MDRREFGNRITSYNVCYTKLLRIGLGTQLIEKAAQIAAQNGFKQLAVIAAIGTRKYYQSRGFNRGQLYMVKPLT